MTKIAIKYLNNSESEMDITGMNAVIKKEFLVIQESEKLIHYVPLCNIKEFVVDGVNQVKG